jgi:hypothetical protein
MKTERSTGCPHRLVILSPLFPVDPSVLTGTRTPQRRSCVFPSIREHLRDRVRTRALGRTSQENSPRMARDEQELENKVEGYGSTQSEDREDEAGWMVHQAAHVASRNHSKRRR